MPFQRKSTATRITLPSLVRQISGETGLSMGEVKKVVRITFSIFFKQLSEGGDVHVQYFGDFTSKTKKATVGRCLGPGKNHMQEYVIPAHKKAVFRPCNKLKRAMLTIPV